MTTLLEQGAAALAAQRDADLMPTARPRTPTPEADVYGVFRPTYAQALAQRTGAAGGDNLNRLALMLNSQRELDAYRQDLGQSQQVAERMAIQSDAAAAERARINVAPQWAPYGFMPNDTSIQNGRFVADPVINDLARGYRFNSIQGDIIRDVAEAAERNYSAGIRTPAELMGELTRAPGQAGPNPYGVFNPSGLNPNDQFNRDRLPIMQQEADAATLRAEASMVDAQNGPDTVVTERTQYFDPVTNQWRTTTTRGPGGAAAADTTRLSDIQRREIDRAQGRVTVESTRSDGSIVIRNQNGTRYIMDRQGVITRHTGGSTPAASSSFQDDAARDIWNNRP